MKIERVWAMPSGSTFSIKPIRELLDRAVIHPCVDPFAANSKVADVTNDLNPDTSAQHHKDARVFLDEEYEAGHRYKCGLFDPPFSVRQINELYKRVGLEKSVWTNSHEASVCVDKLSRLIEPGGIVVSFGWTSRGMGKNMGFEIEEILLVCHGGWHNDTIVVVERKLETHA